jgi:UDP-N-acetylmuramoyl-tripeptide--D-alanyl-D-alanine ligase
MPEFPAQRLAHWTGGRWTAMPVSPLLGFGVDSRQVRPGQVFVAIKTEKRDGHDFLAAALAAGASGAIVAVANPAVALPQLVVRDPLVAFQTIAREHRRAFRGRVVGISGSAGKTSTKDLLALLLGGDPCGVPATEESRNFRMRNADCGLDQAKIRNPKSEIAAGGNFPGGALAPEGNLNKASIESGAPFTGRVLATEGNLNNHLGVPLTLTRLDSDAHDFAVVEAGISAPGEMRPLAEMIEPDVALITLIAPAHTADLGGLDGVAKEKAQLPAATRTAGVAVFSHETAQYAAFRELGVHTMILERADVLRPTEPPKNTVYFTLTQRADQSAVSLAYGLPPPLIFTFRRVSDGMAQNAALAICAALWLGVPPATIQTRLSAWQPAKLRGEIRHDKGRLLYLDCYNANPASMIDALGTFAEIAPAAQPRLYVIGSMEELGPDAPNYHRELGRALTLRADDQAFLIGSHAAEIRTGAIDAGNDPGQVHLADSAAAIADAVRLWRGAVFVKGSRKYQLEQTVEPAKAGSATGGDPRAARAASTPALTH